MLATILLGMSLSAVLALLAAWRVGRLRAVAAVARRDRSAGRGA